MNNFELIKYLSYECYFTICFFRILKKNLNLWLKNLFSVNETHVFSIDQVVSLAIIENY